jgi:DMSO/TMAO reductase YedYZ molybdopterin-dependent catalytic subunit
MRAARSHPPESDLRVVSHEPLNAETVLSSQVGILTPIQRFFIRNHFALPSKWSGLRVDGLVGRPLSLTMSDLKALPSRSVAVTLECAGNGRSTLEPAVPGEQWDLGAVSTAEWTGVPLPLVLQQADIASGGVEVLFEGADDGRPPGLSDLIHFARSLPIDKALHGDTLLAYAMNGKPLPPEHGGPVRLVVPGWYGMASVKWLTHVAILSDPFKGYYQADRYVIHHDDTVRPLQAIEVRAVIVSPRAHDVLPRRRHRIRGYCWSGHAPVDRVDVTDDGGTTWYQARLLDAVSVYAWRPWELEWHPRSAGRTVLHARATDAAGHEQPLRQRWNSLGYANTAAQPLPVTVV